MSTFDAPWWIAGGHALALFAGRDWREHSDIDVLVLARDLGALHRAFPGALTVEEAGERRHPWNGEPLTPGPHTLVFAGESPVQFLLGATDGDEWVFHRGNGRIRLPLARLGSTEGIPHLAPEVALLFKSRGSRPKDERDFTEVLPLLDDARRRWLLDRLRPRDTHSWAPRLARRR